MAKRRITLMRDGNCADYISKLPESVVGHILSRLRIEKAIRTCVLSKDWKYKWTNIYNFTISDFALCRNKTSIFVDFMDRISSISLSHHVKYFSLSCCRNYDFTHMTAWVSPILGPNLETLILRYLPHRCGFLLPQGLLNCTSLRCLDLWTFCTFRVPAQHTFPNLIYLNLNQVDILNDNSNGETMILQFPVLKELYIAESKWLNVKFVELHASSLEKFNFVSTYRMSTSLNIKFVGATLAEFHFQGRLQDTFILTRSTVAFAYLCCSPESIGLQAQKLFNQFSSMTRLHLRGYGLKAYEQLDLLRYDNLERIEIADGANLNVLLKILRAAPNLKFLALAQHKDWNHNDYNDVEVPYCISSSLETVKFTYSYQMLKPRFRLEMFILKYGERLKTFLFMSSDCSRHDKILRALSAFPRVSPCLEFAIG